MEINGFEFIILTYTHSLYFLLSNDLDKKRLNYIFHSYTGTLDLSQEDNKKLTLFFKENTDWNGKLYIKKSKKTNPVGWDIFDLSWKLSATMNNDSILCGGIKGFPEKFIELFDFLCNKVLEDIFRGRTLHTKKKIKQKKQLEEVIDSYRRDIIQLRKYSIYISEKDDSLMSDWMRKL